MRSVESVAERRTARLRRRLDYVRGQIAEDERAGQTDEPPHHWRRAEASALAWALDELARLAALDTPVALLCEAVRQGRQDTARALAEEVAGILRPDPPM